jgi:hypothetical protein
MERHRHFAGAELNTGKMPVAPESAEKTSNQLRKANRTSFALQRHEPAYIRAEPFREDSRTGVF